MKLIFVTLDNYIRNLAYSQQEWLGFFAVTQIFCDF